MPDVTIITTGEELLDGSTVNTNSSVISSLFKNTKFRIKKLITVGDDVNAIISAVNEALNESEIIITTGGLGPTVDDNTVEAISSIINKKIVLDLPSKIKLEDYLKTQRIKKNYLDDKMSSIPDDSLVLTNSIGFAPGFIVKFNSRYIISIPGVPVEAEQMMIESVIPFLHKTFNVEIQRQLIFRTSGIRESEVNRLLEEINLSENISISITAKNFICELTLTIGDRCNLLEEDIYILIKDKFRHFLIEKDFSTPEQELVHLLKRNNLTISTAESCTGGLIAKKLTDISGSSDVFIGSIIAYSNSIKEKYLDVDLVTLTKYGAVSENTAKEMASGIRDKFQTDFAVSTSGIAGPGGGSKLKPVGTVCFGFCLNDKIITKTRLFRGDRDMIRLQASVYAINFLRFYLKDNLTDDTSV